MKSPGSCLRVARAARPRGRLRPSGGAAAPQLNIYIWTNYLPQDVVADFEKRTGIDVRVDTYDSNETLLAKLQSGVADYDLVVPSDYMLKMMIPQKLLRELDRARLPGLRQPRSAASSTRSSIRATATPSPISGARPASATTRRKVAAPVDSWQALFDASATPAAS